jgi:predicted N-formylglutamate amidohydrolase
VSRPFLLLTVEHAGNEVPPECARLFRGQGLLLRSHRGHDAGALWVAQRMASDLAAPIFLGRVSRLVIDLNRSLDHRSVFSPLTRALDPAQRDRIVRRWYAPYRRAVEEAIRAAITAARRPVLHVSVHSFTPILPGRPRRDFDIGLLHDPRRPGERRLCRAWRPAIAARGPSALLNQPYRGWTDGFTTALRRAFPASRYLGIELEVNQRCLRSRARGASLGGMLADTLAAALDGTER